MSWSDSGQNMTNIKFNRDHPLFMIGEGDFQGYRFFNKLWGHGFKNVSAVFLDVPVLDYSDMSGVKGTIKFSDKILPDYSLFFGGGVNILQILHPHPSVKNNECS